MYEEAAECCRNDHRARKESVKRSRSPRGRGTLRAQSLRRVNATVDAMFSFAADLTRLRRSKVPAQAKFGTMETGKVGQLVREASNCEARFPAAKVGVGIKVKIIKATD